MSRFPIRVLHPTTSCDVVTIRTETPRQERCEVGAIAFRRMRITLLLELPMPSPSLDGPTSDALPALRDRRMATVLACVAAFVYAPSAVAQRVQPLFELFATYGRPALAPSVADAYALSGGVRAGGGVGAAVGAMIGRVEVAGFYELGSASVARRATPDRPTDFTRNTIGLRFELPLAELGREFRGMLSGSLFAQTLDSVLVAPTSVGGPLRSVAQRRAPGGRIEAGVEHQGFLGTTWFVTGGLAAAGAGSGRWQAQTTRRGGIGVAPIVSVGLRTREW
jgi:hypothetical protein